MSAIKQLFYFVFVQLLLLQRQDFKQLNHLGKFFVFWNEQNVKIEMYMGYNLVLYDTQYFSL